MDSLRKLFNWGPVLNRKEAFIIGGIEVGLGIVMGGIIDFWAVPLIIGVRGEGELLSVIGVPMCVLLSCYIIRRGGNWVMASVKSG